MRPRFALALASLVAAAGAAAAQQAEPPLSEEALGAGRAEYMVACAACHGESARGAGPYAEFLNIDVPGLTGLAAANGGAFPWVEVYRIVDGRGGLRAHGAPMPLWGERYTVAAEPDFGDYGAWIVAHGRISLLVHYLASLQD